MVTKMVSFDDMDPKNFDGVLLDLDDTLYRYDPCNQAATRACFEHYDFNFSWVQFHRAYRSARTEVTKLLAPQAACRSRLFAFQAMAEKASIANPYVVAITLEEIYWKHFIEMMNVDQKAFDFLVRCKRMQVPTCVVTDMTANIQIKKITRLGLNPYIDHLVTSEEVGAEKPDSRMFQRAASKLDAEVDRCLMIGDSKSKDVEGALAVGMTSQLISLY